MMRPSLVVLMLVCVLGFLGPAFAYVGPGVGLSMLGALWGIVVAIAVAVGFVVAWPLRCLLKGRKARRREMERRGQEQAEVHQTAQSS